MLEDRDGSYWKDTDHNATSYASVNNNTGNHPPRKHKIQWENIDGGNEMRVFGHCFRDELDHHQQCVLCGMKTRFYYYDYFNVNKPDHKTPLCQVKWCSKVTKIKSIKHA